MRVSFTKMVPALALVLSAGAAAAQQTSPTAPPPARGTMRGVVPGQAGPMGRRAGAPGARMRARAGGAPAQRLLALRSQLGLTSDQVTRLEALQKSQQTALKPRSADALRARADLMDAEQKGDLNAAHAVIDRMAKMHADQQFARLQARKSAADVLTADQKAKLEQVAKHRGGMRGAHGMRMRGGRGPAGQGFRGMMQPGRAPGAGFMRRQAPAGLPTVRPDTGR